MLPGFVRVKAKRRKRFIQEVNRETERLSHRPPLRGGPLK